MYFASLGPPPAEVPQSGAWKIAHETADDDRSTVTQNALLGIVAHITYDLPRAIAKTWPSTATSATNRRCAGVSSTTTRSTTCWCGA